MDFKRRKERRENFGLDADDCDELGEAKPWATLLQSVPVVVLETLLLKQGCEDLLYARRS